MSDLDAILNASATLGAPQGGDAALDALLGLPASQDPLSATVGPAVADEAPAATPRDDVEYTGNLETDAASELTAVQAAFRDRAKAYKRQRRFVEDSEFWIAVCFQTREDKEAFLADHSLTHLGDKYLNGYLVADALEANRGAL